MQHDDEIDLFELFSVLWDGKWAILFVTLIALCLGGTFGLFKEHNQVVDYQSTIEITHKHLLPLNDSDASNANNSFADLSALFHSKSEFEAWKESNPGAPIEYGDISLTQVVDGVELASESHLVSFETDNLEENKNDLKVNKINLKVNTNNLQVLDSYYSYLSSLNETLTRQYIVIAREEINSIDGRLRGLYSSDEAIRQTIFLESSREVRELERFVRRAKSGALLFEISRPTLPVVTSPAPKTKLIVALSILLGAFLGAVYVLLCNAIDRRRKSLNAS